MHATVSPASGAACACRHRYPFHAGLRTRMHLVPRLQRTDRPRQQHTVCCSQQHSAHETTDAPVPPGPPLPPSTNTYSIGPGGQGPEPHSGRLMPLALLAAALGAGCIHALCSAQGAYAAQAAHKPQQLHQTATLVIPPGSEDAAQKQGVLDDVTGQQDWQQTAAPHSGGPLTPPTGGPMQAVKRLLRELFSELTTLKQQVEELMPRSEDENMVIPYEGGSVGPVMRAVAPGKHYKSKAQLSGSITWQTPLICTSQDDSSQGSGCAHTHGVLQPAGPHLEVLLQSMWSNKKHSLTARLASSTASLPATGVGVGPTISSAHEHTALPASTTIHEPLDQPERSLQLQSLMYRAELLKGQLKLCVASAGGALCNIARRLNPNTGSSGLTAVAQQGHGVAMVLEQGRGAAVTWVAPRRAAHSLTGGDTNQPPEGPFSASLGHFITGAGTQQHTVGQVSLHSQQAGCISMVLSRASCIRSPSVAAAQQLQGSQWQAQGAPASPKSPQGVNHTPARRRTADLTSTGLPNLADLHRPKHNASSSSSQEVECVWRVGASGTVTLADLLVLSAWHSQQLPSALTGRAHKGPTSSNGGVASLSAQVGGCSTGLQVCSLPDDHGTSLSLTLAAVGQPAAAKQLNMPVYVGRRTGSMGGTSVGGANPAPRQDVPVRAASGEVVRPQLSGELSSKAAQSGQTGAWLNSYTSICELSAHVPLHDGVWLTPGVVLTKRPQARPIMHVACGAGWRF